MPRLKRTQLHVVLDIDHEGDLSPVQLRDAARAELPGLELVDTPELYAIIAAVWVDG